MLDELKTARKVVGIKQLRKSLKGGQVVRVYLAEDADPRVTEPVEVLCREKGIAVEHVPAMKELGAACGIAVGSAVAALVH